MRNTPKYINENKFKNVELNYKWSNAICDKIFGHEADYEIYKTLEKMSYRSCFALGLAVAEWISYLFSASTNFSDSLLRIEAGWATQVDIKYCDSLKYKLINSADHSEGPLIMSLALLYSVHHRFTHGKVDVHESVTRLLQVAFQVIPKELGFKKWVDEAIANLSKTFPLYGDELVFDISKDKIVPREYFENGFEYREEDAEKHIKDFVESLKTKSNPYIKLK